ncbi:50S ribosomal protein L2 [Candidatus Daviesbacteria bacterium RIFCSPLOWO2_02_FULL_40_8]|uniref:50S ribosomal protein L2 n=1 Tax=Candidatus Daviesbacteria bacterium RIFCSPLOWO2_01_FULL_40_24 TaxID=1797787 RepID=A0A1F5MJU4_9BACT|nr:MAG: 50S ribosomal protein L2 [Candidatus Daviesbacteria bacterium RIFCSPHIGHO2_01_FULL_41_45]OGE35382.1 MAG: 50S ribosomal protein L2 [Candidatus Daviesbacteria bacterium RIFCSPHIGHO2_02_FULL_41_14]OGE65625.1 MAG: 50S ribosomal protein L2 [Candidatus Daviesbacteria bacterium RIFCSPLOWO2_01_FULL_40_24]OGE66304.1 MAG: 50S ribosomal protein L2 [Candidatus Daviesbacteria bacterium RIFCSPLOWO2_02_FULL_40_8]
MPLVQYAEKTRTRRFASKMVRAGRGGMAPKRLKGILKKHAGRSGGRITVRHQGGRHRRQYRVVDFLREKFGIEGVVVALEYDPNRNVDLALIKYPDGEYRYILAPKGLKVKDTIISGERVEIKVGNAMKLKNLPIGTLIHNVELMPGRAGQMGRAAGTSIMVVAKQEPYAHLRLPSGEVRMVPLDCLATVGVLGNEEWKNMVLGKAGRARHMGIRPTVRGVAQDPDSHPHGGGEARSGVGRKKPMTRYGRPAVGNTRKKKNNSNKFIVKRRKS